MGRAGRKHKLIFILLFCVFLFILVAYEFLNCVERSPFLYTRVSIEIPSSVVFYLVSRSSDARLSVYETTYYISLHPREKHLYKALESLPPNTHEAIGHMIYI